MLEKFINERQYIKFRLNYFKDNIKLGMNDMKNNE